MVELFVSAFLIGMAWSAVPGVVAAEATRRGATRGPRAAFWFEIGSLAGDSMWAIIALVGLAFITQNPLIRIIMAGFGSALLFWFTLEALKGAMSNTIPQATNEDHHSDIIAGAMISISNVQNLAFWLGLGSTIVGMGVANPEPIHFIIFFLGFISACVAWCFLFTGLIAFGKQFITPRLYRTLNVLCATALGYFAVIMLLEVINLQALL